MGLLKAVLLLAFVVASFTANPYGNRRRGKKFYYSFYNFERSFCQHGVDGKAKKDGNYAHPKYCERFITCEHFEHPSRYSKFTTQYCPSGLFFNEKTGVCDWPRNVNCFLYQGKTCFGSRRSKFGQVRASQTGYIESIKLIHTSGNIRCYNEDPNYKSFWGCNSENTFFQHMVNTWITTRENKNGIIFPTKETYDGHYGSYELIGYNQLSPYMKWYADPYHSTKVNRGQRLRVWYGEDLFNTKERNIRGRHCIEVYVLYSYFKPYHYFRH